MTPALWPNGGASAPAMPNTASSGFRASSEFDPARRHPVTGQVRPHNGLDTIGYSTICSPVDGVVIQAAYDGGWGNHIKIRADNGDEFWMAHCQRFLVGRGTRVRAGTPVAIMGTTGLSTGVHCHWEVRPRGGAPVNPRTYMAVNGRPAGGNATTPQLEEDMPLNQADLDAIRVNVSRVLQYEARPKGFGATYTLGPTLWEHLDRLMSADAHQNAMLAALTKAVTEMSGGQISAEGMERIATAAREGAEEAIESRYRAQIEGLRAQIEELERHEG